MARKREYPENLLHDVNLCDVGIDDLDFSCLTERERCVIQIYYIDTKLTRKEIAAEFEVTELRLRQIVSKAVRKLRKSIIRNGVWR
ncbi:MAG TPA: hypothetical protein IAC37_08820 [Candidatus Ventrimonas merdavium]|nr:hypothetical protein [Candidatus Ventrimonas merdavium]